MGLGGCPGWSESSLGTHTILLVLSLGGSNQVIPKINAAGWQQLLIYFALHQPRISFFSYRGILVMSENVTSHFVSLAPSSPLIYPMHSRVQIITTASCSRCVDCGTDIARTICIFSCWDDFYWIGLWARTVPSVGNTVNFLHIRTPKTRWHFLGVMRPKDAEGIANSVDPDHTAPRRILIWVCTVCQVLSVRKLRTYENYGMQRVCMAEHKLRWQNQSV